jgi:lipid-A-disaccharide synthase
MRIGIVAGEASGDYLGAGLLKSLRESVPVLEAEGIVGPRMQKEGAKSLFPMTHISLIGVDGLIGNLSRLLRIRQKLYRHFIDNPPDLFIGIDLPDFNLNLEKRLRKNGVRTVHYVSPAVWAWRSWRIRTIRQAVDHMLVLFPFEEGYFKTRDVPVTFVGHPAADELPEGTTSEIRLRLGLPQGKELVALLPGSRNSEVLNLGIHFLEAAASLQRRREGIEFAVPYVNNEIKTIFRDQLNRVSSKIVLHEFNGRSTEVMAASNVALVASGTAALEAAMLRKPMIVAYKVSRFSYWLARRVASTPYVSMPNNLVGKQLVPEVLQAAVSRSRLCDELSSLLSDSSRSIQMIDGLEKVYKQLKNNANAKAAKVILQLHAAWTGP